MLILLAHRVLGGESETLCSITALLGIMISKQFKSNSEGKQAMRFLIKVTIPVEAGNAAAKDGTLGKLSQSIVTEMNIDDPSEIPAVAEPFFLGLNASVEFHPAMTPEDLAKAAPSIEQSVKNYG